jgi:SAM-dependent methyltransferase
VTGIDVSATFIEEAKATAQREGVRVEFVVCDFGDLDYEGRFDLVTWIEKPCLARGMMGKIHRSLVPDGRFVGDVRNPDHSKVEALARDWRSWHEENGIFYLERHEANSETGQHEDVWLAIDMNKGTIEEKIAVRDPRDCVSEGLKNGIAELREAGFKEPQLRTLEGELFEGGQEPYWLWLVAEK